MVEEGLHRPKNGDGCLHCLAPPSPCTPLTAAWHRVLCRSGSDRTSGRAKYKSDFRESEIFVGCGTRSSLALLETSSGHVASLLLSSMLKNREAIKIQLNLTFRHKPTGNLCQNSSPCVDQ